MPPLIEDDSDAESNDYDPYGNQGLHYDSDDDENRTASLIRMLLEYIDSRIAVAEPINTDIEDPLQQPEPISPPEEAPSLYEDNSDDGNDELDPATKTSLNPEAKATNIDKEDPIVHPKLTENSDLTVTFSDEEEDADTIVLPTSEYLLYFGWETRYGFHDHISFEPATYEFKDMTIRIKVPPDLKTIYDTPAFHFLTQVKDETIRLDAEVKSSKYIHPSGIAEINFNFTLLSAKILDYASNYGCSTSPSWTLAKDVPEGIIQVMLRYGHRTPLFVHMSQMHIYHMAYIETFWPHIDVSTFRNAGFWFFGQDANSRKTINWGHIKAYKDDLVFNYLVDHETTDNWERDYNAPHDDDGPPNKRCRTGDYDPGDNEPERYSPTSPEYSP